MKNFNLNSDMAEGYGAWKMGADEALLERVDSANIACGYHAGDHNIMAQVMTAAAKAGVSIGAHPGFYDLHGFGRRQMTLSMTEIENIIAYQLGAAIAIADLVGAKITHVKPHGALNNMACNDMDIALAIARAVKAVDDTQIFLVPTLSALVTAGESLGLVVAQEVFADRNYMPDGQLAPRSRPDAMIHDAARALENCKRMLAEGEAIALDGTRLKVTAHSICVHGDEPSALKMVAHLRHELEAAGFNSMPLPELMSLKS